LGPTDTTAHRGDTALRNAQEDAELDPWWATFSRSA